MNEIYKCCYQCVAAVAPWWQDLLHTTHTLTLLAQFDKVSGSHNLTREEVEYHQEKWKNSFYILQLPFWYPYQKLFSNLKHAKINKLGMFLSACQA